jgi:PAS domain S-box-containing protein
MGRSVAVMNRWRIPGGAARAALLVLVLGLESAASVSLPDRGGETGDSLVSLKELSAAPPAIPSRSSPESAHPGPRVLAGFMVFVLLGGLMAFYNILLKKKAAAIRASAELLRTLVEFAPEAIVIIDAETIHFTDANRNALSLFGVDREALLRGGPIDLSPALQAGGRSSRTFMEEKIREAMTGKTPVFEWTCRSAAGKTIPCEVHLVRLPGAKGGRIRGSIIDISERKRIDRMKNEFVSTVSHELRTPITSIRGSLGLLAAGVTGPLSPSAQSMIDVAHRNCERLVRLVNDILDIEKVEEGKMSFNLKPVRLLNLIGRAIILNRPFAQGRSVELRLESEETDALVFGDEDRLMQVLTNLLSNAVKVSPRGETVTIGIHRKGAQIRTLIQDRGPGIPEDFRGRIFQKFAQADRRDDSSTRMGTGLGLAIAKALIEKMSGTIGFETETGRGTTFYFDLTEDTRARAASLPPPAPAAVSSAPELPRKA